MPLAKEKDEGFDNYWMGVAFEKVADFPDNIKDWPVEMLKPISIQLLKKDFLGYAKKLMKENIRS